MLIMFMFRPSLGYRRSSQMAFTAIELLAVMFVVTFSVVVSMVVRARFGREPAAVATVLAFLVGILLVIRFYRWSWNRDKKSLAEVREKYRDIYQVKALPTDDKNIVKPAEAEIQIGDYGWEARPNRRDGLIHLQGLTPRWEVVWHARFRPDQIEKVAVKTVSQYDYWTPYWAKPPPPPPCPYPVRERNTPTMGLPHHSGRYVENNPYQPPYKSPKDMA